MALLTNTFRAMGCEMTVILDGDEKSPMLDDARTWFDEWEDVLSRFRPESELCQVNRCAGAWTVVSDTFWTVFQCALHAAHNTSGLVTPLVLGAMHAAGYQDDFASLQSGRSIAGKPCPHAATVADWRHIDWDARRQAIKLREGTGLDFGGLAKGWAADTATTRLASVGAALVDAGGDIAVTGPMQSGASWAIGVDVPGGSSASNGLLIMLQSGAVATSGRDYRRWRIGTKEAHHIIDPRTGAPACSDVLTATVVAPTGLEAEVAAKTVILLGSEQGLDWVNQRNWLAALAVDDAGTVRLSRRMQNYLWHA